MLSICSFDCQIRCSRWEIKLASWHDPHVYVCRRSRTGISFFSAWELLLTSTLGLYVIVGVTYWFYPGNDPVVLLASCT